jgi:hypothetical protein
MLRSRASDSIPAAEKQRQFLERIAGLKGGWGGPGQSQAAPEPDFGGSVVAITTLAKYAGGVVRRWELMYQYRRPFDDSGSSDDVLTCTFSPSKVDMPYLVHEVLPSWIESFDAYLGGCVSERALDSLSSGAPINCRFEVDFISPICFFDELLCARAFRKRPAEVAQRVKDLVENVISLRSGVYIVGASRSLSVEETIELSNKLRSALLAQTVDKV